MERIFKYTKKKKNKNSKTKHLIKLNITYFIFDLCHFEYYLTPTGSYFLIICKQQTNKTEVKKTPPKVINSVTPIRLFPILTLYFNGKGVKLYRKKRVNKLSCLMVIIVI